MRWRYLAVAVLFLLLPVIPAQAQQAGDTGVTVVITSDLPDAEAWVDGVLVGLTPARLTNVKPGVYVAEVRARGRMGTRNFEVRDRNRRLHVPLNSYANPLAFGVEGTLGFRGSDALLGTGIVFAYHEPQHEFGLVVDWFDLRGRADLLFQGLMARLEYAFVPFTFAGGGDALIMPLKARGRISVAQTTSLVSYEQERAEGSVAGLGLGGGIAAELQYGRFGVEPGFYYDWYARREVSVGGTELTPPLDNGGFNLRLKLYF